VRHSPRLITFSGTGLPTGMTTLAEHEHILSESVVKGDVCRRRTVPQPGPNTSRLRFTSRGSDSRAVPDLALLLHRLGDRLNVPGPAGSIVSLATVWHLTEVGSHAHSPSGYVS
jgi:hypothetical protein